MNLSIRSRLAQAPGSFYTSFTWHVLMAVVILATSLASAAPARAQDPAPRNIILFVGDGMGFAHVEAASRYLTATRDGLTFQQFPLRRAMSTYPYQHLYQPELAQESPEYLLQGTTDSAAAATAMASGKKTTNGRLGIGPHDEILPSIVEYAEEAGMATGLVTSVPISHATPAGFAVHLPDRDEYQKIAQDLLDKSALEVLFGAGHPAYDESGNWLRDQESAAFLGGTDFWNEVVARRVGADANADGTPDPWVVVQSRREVQTLARGEPPGRVVAVAPVAETLQQQREGPADAPPFAVPPIDSSPTLEEFTLAALNVLGADSDGFFLMVESGAIDWASHAGQRGRMIEEVAALDTAVSGTLAWLDNHESRDETLIVVTADHETGYLLLEPSPGGALMAPSGTRWPPEFARAAVTLPVMDWNSSSHTNSLVPLYAEGPGSDGLRVAADLYDPVHGLFLDNRELGRTLIAVLARGSGLSQ